MFAKKKLLAEPAGYVAIRRFTAAILRQSGINTSLGWNWVERFLQRQNARIQAKTSRNVSSARITAISTSNIAPWFDQLTNIIHQYNLTSSQTYNMDETGFQEGESSIRNVVGSRAIKSGQRGSSTNTCAFASSALYRLATYDSRGSNCSS